MSDGMPGDEVTLPGARPSQLEGPLSGAPAGVLAQLAAKRLCRTCTHQERSLVLQAEFKLCAHPLMPINLVTGGRKFPCVIARGYDALCGPMGAKWEFKGHG